jgi:hypothetical protein
MTFNPIRDMRGAVQSEPPPVDKDRGSWLGLVFALAMLCLAAWYFWGSSMRSGIKAQAPLPAPVRVP